MLIFEVCYYHVLWGDKKGRGLDAPNTNQPHILWSSVPTLWPAQNPFLQASVSQSEKSPFLLGFGGWVAIWSLFSVSLHLLPHTGPSGLMVSAAWGEEQEPLISILQMEAEAKVGKGVKVSKKGQDGAKNLDLLTPCPGQSCEYMPSPSGDQISLSWLSLACLVVRPTGREVLRKCRL